MHTRIRLTLLAALTTSALAGCAAPEPAPAPEAAPAVDVAAEAQEIRDLSQEWMMALQAKNVSEVAGFFDANCTTIFDGEIRRGKAEIQANMEKQWAEKPDSITSWSTSEVEVAASGDMAYERGQWTTDSDGPGEAEEEHGEYLTVWKRIDGRWLVMVDSGTTLKAEDEEKDPPTEG